MKLIPEYSKVHKDSLSAITEVREIISALHSDAYIAASADTLFILGDTVFSFITVGRKYEWASLRKGNVSHYMLQKIGFREKFYNDKNFRYQEFLKLEESLIRYAENNGYPFASLRLDSISIDGRKIAGSLNYKPGPQIVFDSVQIIGKAKVNRRFLSRHIRIQKGQLYSQEKIEHIERLLQELPYVLQSRPPVITFDASNAKITLFLEERKANQVDGIVGFLPNEGNNNKLLITGELNINLKNLFSSGKTLFLEWKKFKPQSVLLDASYVHPKLLGSNLDVRLDLNILKQDSLFLNVNRRATISQSINKYGKLSFFTGLKTSNKLSAETQDSAQYISFKYYTYGLGYDWSKVNDIFYPKRGWIFSLHTTIGNKTIQKDPDYPESFYASRGIQIKSTQIAATFLAEKYIPLNDRNIFLLRLNSGKIFNNAQNIFINDLYRIGGLRTLRGFNENNFYTSEFSVGTLEYRFFTDATSYLLVFYDQGYIKNQFSTYKEDFPLGLGAGISFTTGAGVFNFVYSVGKSRDQQLSLNLSKIHFGIISRF